MYVLERHIGKYQALAPGTKKSGLHRGEAFFHRTALSELHTADRWQREGREVLPEARDNPAKINRRRGFKLPPGMDGKAAAGKVNSWEIVWQAFIKKRAEGCVLEVLLPGHHCEGA